MATAPCRNDRERHAGNPVGRLHDDQHGAAAPEHARRACGSCSIWTARRSSRCEPVIGYLHTGFEKTLRAQDLSARRRASPIGWTTSRRSRTISSTPSRSRSCSASTCPSARTVIRVLLAELTRINNHLVWLGTQALDLGAMSAFLYCFREREVLLDLFEMMCGARLMTSFIRPGGLMADLPAGLGRGRRSLHPRLPGTRSTSTSRC